MILVTNAQSSYGFIDFGFPVKSCLSKSSPGQNLNYIKLDEASSRSKQVTSY